MGRHSVIRPHRRRVVHVGSRAGRHRSYAPAMLGALTLAAVLTAYTAGSATAHTVEVPTAQVSLTACAR